MKGHGEDQRRFFKELFESLSFVFVFPMVPHGPPC